MKKIAYIMLLAGLASLPAANAQTTPVAPVQPVDNAATIVIATNPATAPVISEPAPALMPAAVPDSPAAVPDSPAAVPDSPAAAPAPLPAAGIPLIQFSDVKITTAIENLSRQAGINYMMDPKIGYGLPDANGQVKVEPELSIRWENISAENALVALLDNYGLQLIRDKKTGIDRVTMKDPAAPPPLVTRVIQLQYSSVSNMVDAVQSAFTDKRSKVIADRRTSQMVVVATDPEQLAVDTLIAQLDKPTKQVLIETKLIQISSQPSTKKGVDWSPTLSAQNVTFGNNSLAGIPPTPFAPQSTVGGVTTPAIPASQGTIGGIVNNPGVLANTANGFNPSTFFLNADGVKAVISFLNASYDAQTMSTPQIVTLDNETAKIEVTRQVPIINFSGGTQNSSGSSSITYSNVGTLLMVTPRISANDKIWLKVSPEVSSKFGDVTITIPGNAANPTFSFPVPVFDVRKLDTQVLIPNGNTLVMGGLVQDSPSASYSKVPLLGDIPGLGWAFRSESKKMNKDNLVIFITPTIVQDSDFHAAKTDFLNSKPAPMKSPMNPNTMWDGGKPRGNWSNPAPVPGEFETNDKLNNF